MVIDRMGCTLQFYPSHCFRSGCFLTTALRLNSSLALPEDDAEFRLEYLESTASAIWQVYISNGTLALTDETARMLLGIISKTAMTGNIRDVQEGWGVAQHLAETVLSGSKPGFQKNVGLAGREDTTGSSIGLAVARSSKEVPVTGRSVIGASR